MTGSEIKSLTEEILDGIELGDDIFYNLLNIAKTKLEGKRLWQFLKKLDDSNTASSSIISLPSDFAEDYKVMVGSNFEYTPVPFEEQQNYARTSGRYYINYSTNQLKLLGSSIPSETLYIFYKRFTDDITSDTSPVFPSRFHPILAFYVAGYYQVGMDSDDIFARMGPENKRAAMELENSMSMWDTSIAMRAQNNRIGVAESNNEIPLEQM